MSYIIKRYGVGFFVSSDSIPLWIIFIDCVIGGAYFAATESSFSAVNKIKIKTLADDGNKKAQGVMHILNKFDRALATLLLGNNVTKIAGASVFTIILTNIYRDELGADEKRIAVVFNKIDRIDRSKSAVLLSRLNGLFPQAVYVSAATGEGMEELVAKLISLSCDNFKLLTAVITPDRYDLIAFARANAQIYSEEYDDNGALKMVFAIEEKYHHKYTDYII